MAKIAVEDVVIRVLKPGDIDRILEIDEMVSGQKRTEYYQKKFFSALDETRQIVTSLAAEVEHKIVGFIMGEVLMGEFGIPSETATIDTIGIDPKYQRSGVARVLMEEFKTNLKKAGVQTVYTFVDRDAQQLLRFFESSGFSPGNMVNLRMKL